jgi:hypothetical protein
MEEMEKSWEAKLAEAKALEDASDATFASEEDKKKTGGPHLVNLNEDPMLDRKVFYDITAECPLTCGRRGKEVSHKLQLGGMGICTNHLKIEMIDGKSWPCRIVPLEEGALQYTRVNGSLIPSMEGLELKPNDRICIGPSAMFIFKNMQNEENQSMADTEADPISFDFASEEILNC